MRVLSILCALIFALSAEQFGGFLESVYDEIGALNLSQKQQSALTESIKTHHNFLRKWYADMRANNEQMLGKFAESTLKSGAAEFARGEQLSNERVRAEYEFIMSVYEILDGKQRKAFGAKLKGRQK